jgi:hypothetical protein
MKTTLAFLLLALPLMAADKAPAPPPVAEPFYRAGEFNLDLYGTGSIGDSDRNPNNIRVGAGAGATYFFTRGLGFGFRGETDNAGHSFVDRATGRVIVRAPLWDRIAPYGYVDGTFNFEVDKWSAGAGGGLEYRFFRNVGVFAEAGLLVDTEGDGKMRGAAGLRLSF